MAIRKGTRLNLDSMKVDIEDKDPQSEYFDIVEFKPKLNGGKNSISMNGSELLKKGSKIQVEVLDLEKNPLYIEVARSPIGGIKYRDGVSTVISVHVQGRTPTGVGEVIIVGETTDGKKVRWRRRVTIDSKITNADRVRFYKQPELIVEPIKSKLAAFQISSTDTIEGTLSAMAVSPSEGSNFIKFDKLRKSVVYKVFRTGGQEFLSLVEGEKIKISNIILEEGQPPLTDVTFTATIKDVLNKDEILLENPFIYPNNFASVKPVENIVSANFSITYTPIPSSALVKSSDGGNALLQSLARVTVKNIRPFTGNVSRMKLFRKSFQSNSDNELVTDALVESVEILIDDDTPNRQLERLGFFNDEVDNSIVSKYWHTTDVGSLVPDSDDLIDGMRIDGLFGGLPDYVIVKDDTATTGNSPEYVAQESSSMINKSGSSWDSNFLGLFGGVDYTISGRVYNNRIDSSKNTKIEFCLTGSAFDFSSSMEFDGEKIKIAEVEFDSGVNNTFKEFRTDFSIKHDANGTLILIPYSDGFTVSEISIQPKQAFSFSPDIFSIKLPFSVSNPNERYLIRCELFDINNNHIPVKLETTEFFDPEGDTIRLSESASAEIISQVPDATWGSVQNKPEWVNRSTPSFPSDIDFFIGGDVIIGGTLHVGGTFSVTVSNSVTSSVVTNHGSGTNPIKFSIVGSSLKVDDGTTVIYLT